MSYILDALKKSEQQRGHGKIPDVQTIHSSSLNYHNDKKAIWPYILIAAIALNLIAIIYFIADKDSEKITTTAENTGVETEAKDTKPLNRVPAAAQNEEISNIENPINVPVKTNTNDNVQIKQSQSTPVQKNSPSNNATIEAEKTNPLVIEPKENTQEGVIEYYDLPESLQRQIPTITVSAHIYSSNPLQRSIVINNNFLEENDYVLDNLILHEITTDGAIFNYEGTLFHYGVVPGWQ